jgi:MoaE-MoaD fusion protein
MSNPVHVKFFAIFREYIGLKEDWREIEPGTTVQQLWEQYTANAKNPRVANIRAAFSVNQRLAKPETVLNGGEEVGFLPPVSGGGDAERKPRARRASKQFIVTEKKLKLDALIKQVEHGGAGAIITFIGVVRDNAHDQAVQFLEYEAYPELAEQTLAQIDAEVQERWREVKLAIAHRTGRLAIGEASVIIAVSAPHRAEAFAACRYAIERLKVIVPVWKKEFASDTDYWVEGPAAGEIPAARADEIVRAQESEAETANTTSR